VEANDFIERLTHLSSDDVLVLAAALRHEHDSVDGEVAWWRATIAVSTSLKRCHRAREAGVLAHRAAAAVLQAAERSDGTVGRDDATIVARAASDVARALVAEGVAALPAAASAVVLAPWRPVVAA